MSFRAKTLRSKMLKLFVGTDNYTIGKEVSKITATPDVEVNIVENSTIADLIPWLGTDSFFSQKRVFVVKNLLGKIEKKDEEKLIEVIKNLPNDTEVVFTEEKELTKSSVYKFLKEKGTIKLFPEGKSVNLVAFIKEKVQEEGGEIAPLAAERLASFVGPNLWQLSEEVKKLVLYKKGGLEVEPIQTADVDLLVKANFEANIFALTDAIAARNTKKSIELLNSFLESGENAIYILTMIERQFKNIAMAKFENVSDFVLAKKAGIHPFVAKKSVQQAKNFTKDEIIRIYQRLSWADLKLKSGAEPNQILLRILV